jgi:hypothetical protein
MAEITVGEMIAKLGEYNPKAKFQVVVENYKRPFTTCFGSSDGSTKANCDDVSLMVGGNNESE